MDQARDESKDTHRPKIDVSASLGEAGHEAEDSGFEGVPDDGALDETAETINTDDEAQSTRDRALERPQFGLPGLPKD